MQLTNSLLISTGNNDISIEYTKPYFTSSYVPPNITNIPLIRWCYIKVMVNISDNLFSNTKIATFGSKDDSQLQNVLWKCSCNFTCFVGCVLELSLKASVQIYFTIFFFFFVFVIYKFGFISAVSIFVVYHVCTTFLFKTFRLIPWTDHNTNYTRQGVIIGLLMVKVSIIRIGFMLWPLGKLELKIK